MVFTSSEFQDIFDCITASFAKDQLATDNDQLFSIAVCRFMLEETIMGVTLDPEKMDSLMKRMKVKIH